MRKNEERRLKQLKAETMYYMNMPFDQIGKELGVHSDTVYKWSRGLHWKENLELINKRVSEKLMETTAELKERQIKITKGIIAKGIQQLQADKTKVTAGDIIKALEHEKELVDPKQVSFNFQKSNIQNTQITVNESVHDLIEKAKQKQWKTKDRSQIETLNSLNEQN